MTSRSFYPHHCPFESIEDLAQRNTSLFNNLHTEAREMAHVVKCSSPKHEDLSPDPQRPCELGRRLERGFKGSKHLQRENTASHVVPHNCDSSSIRSDTLFWRPQATSSRRPKYIHVTTHMCIDCAVLSTYLLCLQRFCTHV